MIKINLASLKQSGLSGAPKSVFSGTSIFTQLNLEKVNDLPIRKLLAPMVLGVVAYYGLNDFKETQLSTFQEMIEKHATENKEIQGELGKLKSYEGMKKTLDADGTILRTKLDLIQKLMSDRSETMKLLLSISSAIPKEAWLVQFKVNRTNASIKGAALGFSQISDFMKNLRDNAYFSSIEMVDTRQERDPSGIEMAMYELNAKRR